MADTGLTRTAFYRHFDDVPDLVLRLLEDVGRELYEIAERWLEGSAEDFQAAAATQIPSATSTAATSGTSRSPCGKSFWTTMTPATSAIQNKLITPSANRTTINPKQQPTQ